MKDDISDSKLQLLTIHFDFVELVDVVELKLMVSDVGLNMVLVIIEES